MFALKTIFKHSHISNKVTLCLHHDTVTSPCRYHKQISHNVCNAMVHPFCHIQVFLNGCYLPCVEYQMSQSDSAQVGWGLVESPQLYKSCCGLLMYLENWCPRGWSWNGHIPPQHFLIPIYLLNEQVQCVN